MTSTAIDTIVPAESIETYRRDGFVLGPRILDDAQIAILRDEVLRVIADRDDASKPQPCRIIQMGQEGHPIWQVCNICWASDGFDALVRDPQLLAWAGALSGARHLQLWHDQIQYKPCQQGGVNMWHQDGPYWPTLTPPSAMITGWIALDDAEVDNGCMSMVPGSHHWGDQIERIHGIEDFHQLPSGPNGETLAARPRPVKAGYVHFHHPLTWHGSHGNRSGRPRRALAVHYATDEARVNLEAGHLMKPWITSAQGEPLAGDEFPILWRRD